MPELSSHIAKGGNAAACPGIMTNTGVLMDMKKQAQIRCDKHVDWDVIHSTTSKKFTTTV